MFDIKFKCICGKEFDNPQKFNAHKSHCEIHLIDKYGEDEYLRRKQSKLNKMKVASKKAGEVSRQQKELRLEEWLNEEHKCETCGKVMTEYYGSGRFCCQSCANNRGERPEETKQRIRSTLKNGESSNRNHRNAVEYFKNTGEWFEGCILHHIDESLKHTDLKRYNEWRPEDLVVMSKSEHLKHHYNNGDTRPQNHRKDK